MWFYIFMGFNSLHTKHSYLSETLNLGLVFIRESRVSVHTKRDLERLLTLTLTSESESLRLDDAGLMGESDDDPFSSRLMSFEVTNTLRVLVVKSHLIG